MYFLSPDPCHGHTHTGIVSLNPVKEGAYEELISKYEGKKILLKDITENESPKRLIHCMYDHHS